MIIVEGPDGSGKTTVIEKLKHVRRQLKSIRGGVGGNTLVGWSTDDTLQAYIKKIHDAQREELRDAQLIAYDRFHLSEVVYGPILRGRQELRDGDLHLLNDYIRRKQIPVILCLPSFKTTLANVNQEGRERPAFQTEGFLHQAYEVWKRMAPWATTVFDYEKDAFPTL